jgi:hypothetical protein
MLTAPSRLLMAAETFLREMFPFVAVSDAVRGGKAITSWDTALANCTALGTLLDKRERKTRGANPAARRAVVLYGGLTLVAVGRGPFGVDGDLQKRVQPLVFERAAIKDDDLRRDMAAVERMPWGTLGLAHVADYHLHADVPKEQLCDWVDATTTDGDGNLVWHPSHQAAIGKAARRYVQRCQATVDDSVATLVRAMTTAYVRRHPHLSRTTDVEMIKIVKATPEARLRDLLQEHPIQLTMPPSLLGHVQAAQGQFRSAMKS